MSSFCCRPTLRLPLLSFLLPAYLQQEAWMQEACLPEVNHDWRIPGTKFLHLICFNALFAESNPTFWSNLSTLSTGLICFPS